MPGDGVSSHPNHPTISRSRFNVSPSDVLNANPVVRSWASVLSPSDGSSGRTITIQRHWSTPAKSTAAPHRRADREAHSARIIAVPPIAIRAAAMSASHSGAS